MSSALVTPRTAPALVRALQTVSNPHDFRLPDCGEELEVQHPGFRVTSWVMRPHQEHGLDRFDPFSGDLPWPLPRPSRLLERLFGLVPVDDTRVWRPRGSIVADLAVQAWGNHRMSDHGGGADHGTRIDADVGRLLSALDALGRDLILEVAIRRDDGTKTDPESYSYGTNSRIYHLTGSGQLRTLRGCRRLGPEAG